MRVSVILTNYNYARYLSGAITSVLSQSHTDLELIVVDDGSTDESRSVIEKFEDGRMRAIFQENAGQGAAFRAGVALASGGVIALIDSDDEWLPDKLSKCLGLLAHSPGISLLQHGQIMIDAEGQILREQAVESPGFYDPLRDYRRLRFDLPFRPTSCLVAPRGAFDRVRFRPSEWRIAADTPLIAGLSVLGKSYLMRDCLTRYRVHGNNGFEGKQNQEKLLELKVRYYDVVNEHMKRLGRSERFHFKRSPDWLGYRVALSKKWTLHGISLRVCYAWALAKRRSVAANGATVRVK